jgi:hypothetical protein
MGTPKARQARHVGLTWRKERKALGVPGLCIYGVRHVQLRRANSICPTGARQSLTLHRVLISTALDAQQLKKNDTIA